MKKNFFKFLLLGAFTLSLGAGFVGCKDYDDDIKGLEERLNKLEQFQASVGNVVKSLSFSNGVLTATKLDGTSENFDLKTYFAYDIKIEGGKLLVNGNEVGVVGAAGEEYNYDFAIVDGELVITLNGEDFKKLPLASAAEGGIILEYDANGDVIRAYVKDKNDKDVNLYVKGSAADPGSLITDFKVIDNWDDVEMWYQDLDFGTAVAAVDYTFGAGYPGEIKFVKGAGSEDAECVVTVKVNPVSAILTASSISLQDSRGNAEVMDYISVASVEKSDKLITKAAETGLWDITFKMNSSVDKKALEKVVTDENGNDIGYALVIENKLTGAGERYIVGDYMFVVDANDKTPRDFLDFNVVQGKNEKVVYEIGVENVGLVTDMKWTGAGWDATKPANVTSAGRSASQLYSVEIGKDITIKLVTNDVYAYYVTFDDTRALISAGVPDNNQIAAWKGYGITGLNNVVKAKDGVVKINIPAAALNAKIGFNVFAVNYDGHLIDPDGVPFWVIAGNATAPTTPIELTVVPATKVAAPATSLSTQKADFNPGFLSTDMIDFSKLSFELTIPTTAPTPSVDQTFTGSNIKFYESNGTTVTTDPTKIAKIELQGVMPYIMKKDTKFTGTLTFRNALGAVVRIYEVNVTKPDAAFPNAFALKTGYTAPNGVLEVILNGAGNGSGTTATFDMGTYLTAGTEGFVNYVFTQDVKASDVWFAATGTNSATSAKIQINGATPVTKIGSGASPLKVSYDWGYFDYLTEDSSNRGHYAKSGATVVAKLDIKSSVQKAQATGIVAKAWNFTEVGLTVLPAGETRTFFQWGQGTAENVKNVISLDGLKVMNPAINQPYDFSGANADAALTTDFNITSYKVGIITEGAGGTEENPDNLYFEPTASSSAREIKMEEKISSSPEIQIPSKDLKLTLVLEVTDQFGNTSFWKSADGVFKGVVNALPDSE